MSCMIPRVLMRHPGAARQAEEHAYHAEGTKGAMDSVVPYIMSTSSVEHPVEGCASKGAQELAELMRQGSFQRQQDHLQQADQYPFSASHQRYKQHEVPALLDDDLTELTASGWVQHSPPHHSSHTMHHSSGVIFAPMAAHSHASSSARKDGSSNADSRHLGFFHDVRHPDADAATSARPSTAGPALHAAQQQHPTGAVPDSSSSSRAKADLLQQQQQKTWLQFQHVPQSSSDDIATLTRSRSSPEPAVQAYTLLQQDLSPALPQHSTSTMRSDKPQQGPPAGSTTVRAPAHIAAREQLLASTSSRPQLQQRQQGTWQDLSPAGPEYGVPKSTALARRSLPGDVWCTSDEAQLLLQKPLQASAGMKGQPLQQQHSWGGYPPDLPVDRPASTPPGFLVNGQQFRTATPQPSLPQFLGSPRTPAALQDGLMDAPAGSLFYGADPRPRASWSGVLPVQPVSPTSRSPVLLSPDAAAAAATAASSIQQALAAVEEELQQLRVLQELNKQRRKLQANARVAVAQAAAAAAASVAGQTHRLGVLPTAGLHGRLGSVGSSGSSVVNSGSSGSGSGSGFSTGSLGNPVGWVGTGQQSYSQNDRQSVLGGNTAPGAAGLGGGLGPAAQSGSSSGHQRVVNAGAGMNAFTDASPSVDASGPSGGSGWSGQPLLHAQRQQPVLNGHYRSSSSSSAAVSAANQQLLADDLNSELHQLAGDAQQLFQLEQILHSLRQA